jgi:negative regulator of sigma E activity
MNDAIKMQISAFVDGELPQNEAELLLRRLCQDAELRQQASEYLAMGRIMRGERVFAGIGMLRERVAAAIDDKELQQEFEATQSATPRFVRPLAGFAIAATVAVAALLGLQQMSDVTENPDNDGTAVVEVGPYTVPQRENDLLFEYISSHPATSSYADAEAINARLDLATMIREESEPESGEAETAGENAEPAQPAADQTP